MLCLNKAFVEHGPFAIVHGKWACLFFSGGGGGGGGAEGPGGLVPGTVEVRSQPGGRPFCRPFENAAAHRARRR